MKRLSHEEFMELLNSNIQKVGSQAGFAAAADVSTSYLSDVLKERRAPGPKLLRALGFREVKLYERIKNEE